MNKHFFNQLKRKVNKVIDKSLTFHHQDLHRRLDYQEDRLANIEKLLMKHYQDDML